MGHGSVGSQLLQICSTLNEYPFNELLMNRWILLGGALLVACSNGTEPGSGDELLVTSPVDTMRADSTVQLNAVLRDDAGDTATLSNVVWSSRNPDVASIDEDGVVTGHASGIVTLVALAGNLRGTRELRVERRFHARDVATGSSGLCAVDLDGQVWCEGAWGTGPLSPSPDPDDVRTFTVPVSGDERYTLVGSNSFFACGISATKHAFCWGNEFVRGFNAAVPTAVAPSTAFDTLSVDGVGACGLSAGTAWCWGNSHQQAREITTGSEPFLRIAVQASRNDDTCGWPASGVPFCWIGLGDPSFAYVPLEPTLPDTPTLSAVANGGTFFCGLDADHHAWCWGNNTWGQLGDGSTDDSDAAVEVVGGHAFTLLAASQDENSHRVCGIAEHSELFCWGEGFGAVPAAVLF